MFTIATVSKKTGKPIRVRLAVKEAQQGLPGLYRVYAVRDGRCFFVKPDGFVEGTKLPF